MTDSAVGGVADAIQSGVGWVVSHTVDWWVQIPSPDLASDPAVGALQRWLLPVTVTVAVMAMLAAAAKMALTRKANPLVDVASGLVVIAATSALGVLLPSMLVKAGDAWSSWVLNASTSGQFATRLTHLLMLTGAPKGVVLVLGVVAIIMSSIQAVLMLFRQVALVILAGVLPLAAAGTLAQGTRAWFRRVTGWMLALVFYKPAAAAVYAAAFTMIGRGRDPRTVLMAFAMVLLSLLALPVLMRFFTWTTGAVEAGAAGGGFLGTVVSGAIAVGAVRASAGGGWGASAIDQARMMSAQLGPSGGPGPGTGAGPQGPGVPPGGSGPGTSPAGPAGAGTSSGGVGPPVGSSVGRAGSSTGAGSASTGGLTGSGAASAAGMGAARAAGGPVGMAVGAASEAASGAAHAVQRAADATQPGTAAPAGPATQPDGASLAQPPAQLGE
ncbi:MAG TPA: hypothetical protein VGS19_18150 [Streptosporangiaceae bacterium]|nr:hypothetical protein [Streptosporangiaceae bacterium]